MLRDGAWFKFRYEGTPEWVWTSEVNAVVLLRPCGRVGNMWVAQSGEVHTALRCRGTHGAAVTGKNDWLLDLNSRFHNYETHKNIMHGKMRKLPADMICLTRLVFCRKTRYFAAYCFATKSNFAPSAAQKWTLELILTLPNIYELSLKNFSPHAKNSTNFTFQSQRLSKTIAVLFAPLQYYAASSCQGRCCTPSHSSIVPWLRKRCTNQLTPISRTAK